MHTSSVSPHIERLVDHLRSDSSRDITIGDVAGVTEVLLSTMQRYFNSLDLSIYDEFRNLTDHIKRAREEIAELRPNDLKQEKIPRAGAELEAIVQATEEATGTIMDAAEEIMAADTADADAYQQAVNDACMRIFEACSFQDITGQRITKVVSTLTFIEERLNTLQVAWGPQIDDSDQIEPGSDDDERVLLNGPALAGEGIEQDDIDRLLSTGDDDEGALRNDDGIDAILAESALDNDAATNGRPPQVDRVKGASTADSAGDKATTSDMPASPKKPANGSGESSQADIDALFD